MMKKILLILLSCAGLLRAENNKLLFADDELFYNIGIELAAHEQIKNWDMLKVSSSLVYNHVEQSQDYFDLLSIFMGADETSSINEVMDIFESTLSNDFEQDFKNDLIEVIAVYQNIFYLFNAMTLQQPSFALFANCIENRDSINNYKYDDLYQMLDLLRMKLELFSYKCDDLRF